MFKVAKRNSKISQIMKKIEDIIYKTTREVLNVEDKLRIGTIFLFCLKLGSEELSELLYSDDPALFIHKLNEEYSGYEVDLRINFDNPNVKNAFHNTRKAVIKAWDDDGFLKALFNKDPFALACNNVVTSVINLDEFKRHK